MHRGVFTVCGFWVVRLGLSHPLSAEVELERLCRGATSSHVSSADERDDATSIRPRYSPQYAAAFSWKSEPARM